MRENALVVPKSGLRRRKIPGCANMMSKSTHSVQGPSLDWVVFQQPAKSTIPELVAHPAITTTVKAKTNRIFFLF